MKSLHRRRGAALVVALVTLLVVMLIAGTLVRSILVSHRQMQRRGAELQAEWLAESAVSRAISRLGSDSSYQRESWSVSLGEDQTSESGASAGLAEIRVEQIEAQPKRARIVVEARFPNSGWRMVQVHREYTVVMPNSGGRRPAEENEP